ncbi:MAG: Pca regulon regulatory protein [Alphaproteobacteria bacterium MarineAlpha2_Bin1]|nr:MAG: Pca regulon regulatory protein [Alphaproteobacteria bacterium MarineAlpha2_Bin1]|tara:strand:- start:133 stop:927 length:795 start_codon:yes stop_codon:yes gene_type:complete
MPDDIKNFRPVRSLLRGLKIIRAINYLGPSTISEISNHTGLPRGTVYRMLETLSIENYITKNPNDKRFRLLSKINTLNNSFTESDWIFSIAKPLIEKLCSEIIWPISIATCNGKEMILRETTDENSPLALRRITGGFRVPILASAAGRVFLSYTDQINRQQILSNISKDKTYHSNSISSDTETVNKIIDDVRASGFSIFSRADLKQSVFAVPINTNYGIIGTIALRFIDTAISKNEIKKKYFKSMIGTSNKIARLYELSLNRKN